MAESVVQVNSGTGPKLHTFNRTIGANSVEDEVVVQGEPYLAEYRATTGATYISCATADSHLVQIMAGATLNVYVRRIRIYQHAVATTAAFGTAQVHRLSTAGTGGTVFAAQGLDTTDAACGASIMTLPTAKGAEGGSLEQEEAIFMQTMGASNGPVRALLYDFDFTRIRQKSIRIPAGLTNGICVKQRTAIAAATAAIVVEFTEANF